MVLRGSDRALKIKADDKIEKGSLIKNYLLGFFRNFPLAFRMLSTRNLES